MNIFSEQNFSGVQEVVKNTNGQTKNIIKKDLVQDEITSLNQQSQKIQELIEELDAIPDAKTRSMMHEFVQEMLSFYGHGLKKILDIISHGSNSAAKDIYNDLIEDSFVTGLLLIHDLHPLDLKTRLHLALEKVKPYMDSHGGNVEIVSLENGVAKLKLSGSCKGCPSSASTLELGIKEAIEEICPDLAGLEVEGVVAAPKPPSENGKEQHSTHGWKTIDNMTSLKNGAMKTMEVTGTSLLICRVNDKLYAYRNVCPACGVLLNNGKIEGTQISCSLGHKYEIQQAGRCTDDPEIHLDPFPLLEETGIVKVAVS